MCDFKMFNLENTNSVELTAVVQGPTVEAAYDNEEFEIMSIVITDSTSTITFVMEQPSGQQIAAEGRLWCRMDDEPWKPFEQSGQKLTYDVSVPGTEGTVGYELRFALADEVANNPKGVVWKDPKMIISRKGQFGKQYAAR
jgi:hypothetical protein